MTEPLTSGRAPEAPPPLVVQKLHPPSLGVEVIHRPRLVERLDGSPARLVLVSAPAGFGKSVLVLDWIRSREHAPVWVSVDDLDNDPRRFFAHLAEAFRRRADPGFRSAATALDRALRADRDPGPATVAALGHVRAGGLLVLDDVHRVDDARVWSFLGRIVAQAPPHLRIVLLSREDPPLRLGRLRTTGELLEIRERDLRFQEEESSPFFRAVGSGGLSSEAVGRLVARTEGWAAGLRLAAVALRSAPDPDAAVDAFGGTHDLLVDYLLEEVLRGRDDALQRFLLETSILPRFTADTCRAVTGDPDAAARLGEIEEANLFLVALDPERRWFRYHQLFAELLTFRLERLDPGRVALLRRRASAWFEAHDDLSEALAQAALVPDPEVLVALLDRHGYGMLARSEFGAFQRWLERVPDPESVGWPMFQAAVAWYRAQTDRGADLEPILDRVEASVADPPPGYPPGAVAEAEVHRRVIRAFRLRAEGRLDEALAHGREAWSRIPSGARRLRGMVEFHIGAVHLALADMPAAEEYLERARATTDGGGLPYLLLASLGHLGAVAAQMHGVPTARGRLEEAMALARARELDDLPAFGIVLYQAADVHALAGDDGAAETLLSRAAELTRDERRTDVHGNVLLRLARLDARSGRPDRAHERLSHAAAMLRSQSLRPFGTTLELEAARLAEAEGGHLLTPDHEPAEVRGSGPWTLVREAWTVLRMQHALKADRRNEAVAFARTLEEESRRRRRRVALALALLTRSAGAEEAADRHRLVNEALTLAEGGDYVQPLLDGGAPVGRLLEASLGWRLSERTRRFVEDRVLPRFRSRGDPPPIPVDAASELTDRERELLAHLAEGHTNRDLAGVLFVSENTVKTHLKHIYAKLDVSSRTAAVDRARRMGLLEEGRRPGPPGSPEG